MNQDPHEALRAANAIIAQQADEMAGLQRELDTIRAVGWEHRSHVNAQAADTWCKEAVQLRTHLSRMFDLAEHNTLLTEAEMEDIEEARRILYP